MALPTFTLAQIIQQLQTQWGGADETNGITYGWAGSNVTYSINASTPTNVSGYTPPEGGANIVQMSATMIATARLAFELWDDLVAINLNESSGNASANITFNYSSNTRRRRNI